MKYSFQEIQEAYDRGDFEALYNLEWNRIEEILKDTVLRTTNILRYDQFLVEVRIAQNELRLWK